ncbi:MAG: DCC1-like thiol-disulfide oxidoreductase family protein [Reyranella sp.]|nr:DCC1-like thiol-disulfide oxidoreductase family protein [Reyranella sp.]
MARDAFSYRGDPAVPAFPDDRPILIFDGNCVLCSSFAQFILRTDRSRRFRLLAAQTPLGAALYAHFGLDAVDYKTNILIEDGRAWLKSEGSIRIFDGLGFPWSLVSIARLLPRPLRDWLYEIVARNRLRWFGVRETCYLPDPSEADRFIG